MRWLGSCRQVDDRDVETGAAAAVARGELGLIEGVRGRLGGKPGNSGAMAGCDAPRRAVEAVTGTAASGLLASFLAEKGGRDPAAGIRSKAPQHPVSRRRST
jgi:hypothetical protein